jgi:hypothetical protein
MSDYLPDTNVFSQIFKGNLNVQTHIESLSAVICPTVYIECVQGSKSNQEKLKIKKYLATFGLLYLTPSISLQAISLIDTCSNTHGLMLADAQIADVCLEHDLTLVTYNIKDFQFIAGLKITVPPFPTI